MRKFLTYIILSLTLTSCGEYQRVLKSNDANVKYEYAKRSFEQGKYVQAASVLGEIVTLFKGTEKAEETLFMLAMCNYENKDYLNSGSYFRTYYQRYPKGKYAEDSRFFCGYGYYLDSPDAQLDQSGTVQAIQELQSFLEMYPKSEKVPVAQNAILKCRTNSRSSSCRMPNFITISAHTAATISSRPLLWLRTRSETIRIPNTRNSWNCWC